MKQLPNLFSKDGLDSMTKECDKFVVRLHYEQKQFQQSLNAYVEQCHKENAENEQNGTSNLEIINKRQQQLLKQQEIQIKNQQDVISQFTQAQQSYQDQQQFQSLFSGMLYTPGYINQGFTPYYGGYGQQTQAFIPQQGQIVPTAFYQPQTPQAPIQDQEMPPPMAIPPQSEAFVNQIPPLPAQQPQNQTVKKVSGHIGAHQKWNGYTIFCTYNRPKILKEFQKQGQPALSSKQAIQILGERWTNLTEEEKNKWREEASKINLVENENNNATNLAPQQQKNQQNGNEGQSNSQNLHTELLQVQQLEQEEQYDQNVPFGQVFTMIPQQEGFQPQVNQINIMDQVNSYEEQQRQENQEDSFIHNTGEGDEIMQSIEEEQLQQLGGYIDDQ